MGIVMKKMALLATTLAMISAPALAADMSLKAVKAPPPPAFEPWDIAFGSALMNDYIFRGITQSNHKPSVAAYFEPRYNINKDLQLYIGAAGESISFPNLGAWGNYASITGKWTAPSTTFGASGFGMYISGEFGRQWLGTSDAFYGTTVGTAFGGPFPNGIPEPSYNTWNIGVGFTYKVFTLDLRYSDTNLSKGDCNAFTSDYTATRTGFVTAINPGGFGSNWCGAAGIVKLSADLTAMTNLK